MYGCRSGQYESGIFIQPLRTIYCLPDGNEYEAASAVTLNELLTLKRDRLSLHILVLSTLSVNRSRSSVVFLIFMRWKMCFRLLKAFKLLYSLQGGFCIRMIFT